MVGESGIGKTTFLKMIYFDIIPDKGNVVYDKYDSATFDRTDVPKIRQKTGIVFQDFKLLNDRNIFENIALPLYIAGEKTEVIKRKVFDAASVVGLINKVNDMPYDLSGGEQQRVAIARSLINDPPIILADEPTGNLDSKSGQFIMNFLEDLCKKKGKTIILITHDLELLHYAHKIVHIKDGKIESIEINGKKREDKNSANLKNLKGGVKKW